MKKSIFMLGMVILLSGCTTTKSWQAQPEFNPANVKRIGVVVPAATVRMIDAGNSVTVDQDLSVVAKTSVEQGTVDALKKNGYEVSLLSNKEDVITFMKGYGLLIGELVHHFPNSGTPTKPSKIEGFDQIRKNSNLDCVVAVEGLDHKSTPGRKAKMAGLMLLGVSGGHGLTKVHYNVFCGDHGKPMYSEMFIESSDLTDPSSVSSIVGSLVEHMKTVVPTI